MKSLLIIFCLFFQLTCFGQSEMKAVLDSVLWKTKETSMYSSTVNWDSLQKAVYLKAENAATIQDLKPAFETLLNGLRDHHGKILDARNYSYIAWFTDYKNKRTTDNRTFDTEVWKIVNDTALKFAYSKISGNVGYLKIVGIPSNVDVGKESRKIRDAVVTLGMEVVEHWIIDLRYNGGGNMHPMMAGIAPLMGNGIAGSIVNSTNEKLFDWEIKSSNFIYGGYQAVEIEDPIKWMAGPKIAVLTSRWTVSSGELVATALKGRPQTKFFGEKTGGFTTNAGWEVIDDKIILVISTGLYADRNNRTYPNGIPPDVEFPFEIIKDIDKDNCVQAAVKWLKEE